MFLENIEEEYVNEYQKSYVSSLGNLYIVISKDKDIDDMFDKTRIDNDDSFGLIKVIDDKYDKEMQ